MKITKIDFEIMYFIYVIKQLKALNEDLAKDNEKFENKGGYN